ncbi:organic hydroperoxide resistance protein, OsmC family [Bifidobacterium actinocoloniiforme DSM 22766]|uniref:Organic hydroperoxide resistance protein, OsmC family n=1 Tax=Bifidobacterium actinocoloniiforme DSM 22766 TaxID=1437605 RepID=A0A086Z1B0_9BIFI|nr:Ohr family peroxiredoxin [Bifidobacterium actinocoloniiforme]AKV55468.1 Ohr subfamily peroxiredoxin [Bifidobacterium actinocoloniiforme DSM 22766]KFI40310.1 organic hydroperoxide resistance protein, OsmC family [Bifidobacterium actinocoloniiforme DSM 22766]
MSTYTGKELSTISYTAVAEVVGGRNGHAESHEPDLSLDLDTPVAMGGKGQGTNPEQLFAIGWGACFQGAMGLAGKELRVAATKLARSKVRVSISFGDEGESFGIKAKIEVNLPGVDRDLAERLVDRTQQLCPYSKATQGNVPTELVVVDSLD